MFSYSRLSYRSKRGVCVCVLLGGLVPHFRVTNSLPQGVESGYHGNMLAYRQERKKGEGVWL